MTPRVFAVDDEPRMLSIVSFALQTQGFEYLSVVNTARTREYLVAHSVNLMALDTMTPTGSGIDLVRRIRARGDDVPIILLTALGDEENRITGLGAGTDDYVTKPSSLCGLALRAQATVRRSTPAALERILDTGELHIDVDRHAASWKGEPTTLSPTELKVFATLVARVGQGVAWCDLLNEAWETTDATGTHNMIKTAVYCLCRQLGRVGMDPGVIQLVRGRGYRLLIDKGGQSLSESQGFTSVLPDEAVVWSSVSTLTKVSTSKSSPDWQEVT